MIKIRINSAEYRIWLKKQNKKKLIARTKKKTWIRLSRTNQIKHNTKIKIEIPYNKETRKFLFKAPLIFSFVKNSEETNEFFHELSNFILDKKNIEKRAFIDISAIEYLSIDALMYLLAILNNIKCVNNKFSVSGNEPRDAGIKKMFIESGFYSYVKYKGNQPLTKNTDTIQILTGYNTDTNLAKQMSDFAIAKMNVSKSQCRFLYIMMIELMSNTIKHAYNDEETMNRCWYCYSEYNRDEDSIAFTFVDTGEGIPSTVRKNFAEKLDILKIYGEDKYVISALNGKFRTSTLQSHRGKGLPKIRDFCFNKKIQDMRIITNKADVTVGDCSFNSTLLTHSLKGTLYYWKIYKSNFKGEYDEY